MMKPQERIFHALGGIGEDLLARSEAAPRRRSPRLLWAIGAAASLAVGIFLAASYLSPPPSVQDIPAPPAAETPQPPQEDKRPHPPDTLPVDTTIPIADSAVGQLHTVKLAAAAERPAEEIPDFYLFVDNENYTSFQEDGVYIIRTLFPPEEDDDFPVSELRITHQAAITLDDAEAALRQSLSQRYSSVSDTLADDAGRRSISALGGSAWNSPVRDVWLVEDGLGGVFTLTADYFLEASEGHGIRFADMVSTFRVVDETTPQWLPQLRQTAEAVTRGVLSQRMYLIQDLLTADAQMQDYGQDILWDVSIGGFDLTPDDPQLPLTATVSVRVNHLEDGADFLTLTFRRIDGRWLACRSEINK